MNWQPISEVDIYDLINRSYELMSPSQRRLWELVKLSPIKWQQHSWGDEGNGFWVVAITGKYVIWYNDIEEGFNRSAYSSLGVISEYWCNQDGLETVMQYLLDEIRDGHGSGGYCSPPSPIA